MPHARREGDRTLTAESEKWPTPNHADAQTSEMYPHKGGNPTLPMASANWSSPRVTTGGYTNSREGVRPTLQGEAEQWAMPRANGSAGSTDVEWEPGKKPRRNGQPITTSLTDQVAGFPSSLPAPATCEHGSESSASDPTSRRRLNPAFVEWLMGWPEGWTDFAPVGTELSLWRRRMRSSLSRLVCGETTE